MSEFKVALWMVFIVAVTVAAGWLIWKSCKLVAMAFKRVWWHITWR